MAEKVEFEFPDEIEEKQSRAGSKVVAPAEDEVEAKDEIQIEDDTPEEDRGRKPSKEKIEEVTDEELSAYDEKVQARFKKFTRGYHDERRAKEAADRERQEAIAYAKKVAEQNRILQERLSEGEKQLVETYKSKAEVQLAQVERGRHPVGEEHPALYPGAHRLPHGADHHQRALELRQCRQAGDGGGCGHQAPRPHSWCRRRHPQC